MSHFSKKIDQLPETIALLADFDTDDLCASLDSGRERRTIAVGSGGSLIAASYLARCRETVFGEPTYVGTPSSVVLGSIDLSNADVWLFSASAEHPDIEASIEAAIRRCIRSINLVTRNPTGNASLRVESDPRGRVYVIPVSDRKDGFLATHSLIGTVGVLLRAFDSLSDHPIGNELPRKFVAAVREAVSPAARSRARSMLSSFSRNDVLVILADPQLEPVSLLLETSAWETALCPIQRTDPRNFAHGRHTWIHNRGDRTILLGLVGSETRNIWTSIAKLLPPGQRRVCMSFGDCGRFRNAVGIVEGMVLIEAMSRSVGIDPAKPIIGPFGKPMYENAGLQNSSTKLIPAVLQKRAAVLRRDDPDHTAFSIQAAWRKKLTSLSTAKFHGLVLDYDGTIVRTENRCEPPSVELIDEIVRLSEAGSAIGIATGRGGSAGEELRKALPKPMHPQIVMGYYNGAYIRSLHIDISKQPVPPDKAMEQVFDWLQGNKHLFREFQPRNSGVQIRISIDDLESPDCFLSETNRCSAIALGAVKVIRSGHGIDLIKADVSKTAVVEALAHNIAAKNPSILRIGDSGSRGGNDYELLSHELGISVDEVCGLPGGTWSLFGQEIKGPDALIRVLRALKPSVSGTTWLDLQSLGFSYDQLFMEPKEHVKNPE